MEGEKDDKKRNKITSFMRTKERNQPDEEECYEKRMTPSEVR